MGLSGLFKNLVLVIQVISFVIIGQSCFTLFSTHSSLRFPPILHSSWSPWLSNTSLNRSSNSLSHCRKGLYNPVKATWNERASTSRGGSDAGSLWNQVYDVLICTIYNVDRTRGFVAGDKATLSFNCASCAGMAPSNLNCNWSWLLLLIPPCFTHNLTHIILYTHVIFLTPPFPFFWLLR